MLSTMKYLPAIPVLIKNIQFADTTIPIIEDANKPLAARNALALYGDAAVPDVIEAYLETMDDVRRDLLMGTISRRVAAAYLAGLRAQHDPRVTDDIVQKFTQNGQVSLTDKELRDYSVSLYSNYDKVGWYWMNVLDDENALNRRRVQASKILGHLKYLPAIPVLIKHIQLFESGKVYTENDEGYIVQHTLGQYGPAAVPSIIDSYLSETDSGRRSALSGAIHIGKTQRTAMTYAQGLHALHDNRVSDDKLQELRATLMP